MALIEKTLFGKKDKVQEAIKILKKYEPSEGYYLGFSGGKDSLVCYWLTKMAEVKCDYHYHMTTVDPPELVKFVRSFEDVQIDHPGSNKTMWNLIIKYKFPPTRHNRYCCRELKEGGGGYNRVKILGVREDESIKRRGREVVQLDESSPLVKGVINLIYYWSESDVWEFLNCNLIDYCELYDKGWDRVGCVGCPLANSIRMRRILAAYPLYARAYVRTFDKMLEERKKAGLPCTWETGQEVYDWWIQNEG